VFHVFVCFIFILAHSDIECFEQCLALCLCVVRSIVVLFSLY